MSSSNCCFLTWIQISQEAGLVVWYSHLFQNFPQFIVIHTVKGFGIVNKAESAERSNPTSKVRRGGCEETYSVVKNKWIIPNKIWVEIWMLKVFLVKYQMEVRNRLLEMGGKVILVESGKELNWVGFYHFVEGRTCQWWNLMIFKQNIEGSAWILLTAYTKMQE